MNKLFYYKSAANFCEALPLGNGRLGVAVYGGVNEDVYALNDDTLWSGYPRKITKNCVDDFKKVKELVLSGDIEAAEALTAEKINDRWSQSYLPAGNLIIKGDYGDVKDYKRTLCLETAIHTVEFDGFTREMFASHPDDVLCIRYEGALPELNISLEGELKPISYTENDMLFLEGEAPGDGIPLSVKADNHHIYSDDPKEKGMRYGIGVRVKTDGTVTANNALIIRGASWLEVYVTVKTSFAGYNRHPYIDGIDYKGEIVKILDRACEKAYGMLRERHIDDYSALFSRLSFELEGGREDLPTDQRLILHEDTPDLSLYALVYQFGRYLMIASSRKGTQPTNLQGIWNIHSIPPWCSGYTTNINLEMNYWGACGANLAECCDPLNRMVYELAEAGKTTAKNFFGAEGFCTNHNTDLWRSTHPVGMWSKTSVVWGYFPLAGAWLTRHLYEYYIDTKDLAFLNGPAFDAIMGSALFCDSMLEEIDGKLLFCPATSPENKYTVDGKQYSLSLYSAMYQSIVRDAFEICIETCDITGRDTDYARYLEKRLESIPWLELTSDGRIAEYDGDIEEFEPHHRHLSHLYSFYPAKKVKELALIEACKKTLDFRGERSPGWSCAWKICMWAALGEGNRAGNVCDELFNLVTETGINYQCLGGLYANLLCAHPPFQIDGNFGFVAGVNEMLATEKDGKVILLPAIPDHWKSGKVSGLRVNGKTVNIEWRDGKIINSSVI